MRKHKARVWLVNTGWSGGPYGVGKRMSLEHTRALITAALENHLDNVPYENLEIFGLAMPTRCPGVPAEILNPKNTWADPDEYDHKANDLATAFLKNFEKFSDCASTEIMSGAPRINVLTD